MYVCIRTNGGKMETTSRQTVCGFQNTPELKRAKTYSALVLTE